MFMTRLIFAASIFFSFQLLFSQQNNFDVVRISAEIEPTISNKSVRGKLVVDFKILKDTDTVFLDAINMEAEWIKRNKGFSVLNTSSKIAFVGDFLAEKNYQFSISYSAQPKQALYFVGFEDNDKANDQIFTQGQGKYTSHWLPSIDDMNDKIEFDLTLIVPKNYGAIANGKLTEQWVENDTKSRWVYDMEKPMSSYLVALSVGDYTREIETSASGIELHKYILKQDSTYLEPTYRYTKTIFDYLEKKIGVPYPWQNYKQVPVRDFLYAGMENTSLTIFSDAFVVDSTGFHDRNYVNVNAHELAHQWFGNLVTETDSRHHWLHEGFATYYALLAERQIFGDDYFYHKLYQNAELLKAKSDRGEGEPLLKKNASSLTYYQKGAWALFMLNNKVGDEIFDKAVQNFLNNNAYQNVTTDDFMNEVKALTDLDLLQFEADWLKQSAFKADQALAALEESLFIPKYFELMAYRELPIDEKLEELDKALSFPINDYIGQEAIYQMAAEPNNEKLIPLYKKAFASGNLWVRQAIAESLKQIPIALKSDYESLLTDQSYQTQEYALLNLWLNFQEEKNKYLKQMCGRIGFKDKNIRQLWLTLNLVTPDYEPKKTNQYLTELVGYTSSEYRFQIREHAFGYLYQINAFPEEALLNLLDGCFHHTWRFRDFCRKLLKTLIKDSTYKVKIENIRPGLNAKQINYLDKL
jgi:aminopeptidase N